MVEVTDADREAAKQHQQRFLTEGASEASLLWEAFTRHRIAAEQRAEQRGKLEGARLALEAAGAKVRQLGAAHYAAGNDDGDMICSIIADDLAALDPAKIVGEG